MFYKAGQQVLRFVRHTSYHKLQIVVAVEWDFIFSSLPSELWVLNAV